MSESENKDVEIRDIVEIWKTIVDVQKHFNDIEMRIRSLFVTILLASFASIGFMQDKKLFISISGIKIMFSTVVPLFGIFGTWLFYFMDRYWYHRLLVGTVKHAISIESKYKNIIPEISLSDAIGAASPVKPRFCTALLARLLVSDDRFLKTGFLHSDGKMELFYKSVMLVLFLITVPLGATGGVEVDAQARQGLSAPTRSSLSSALSPTDAAAEPVR